MQVIDISSNTHISSKHRIRASIALGYFDCVHIGHRRVLQTAIDKAKSCDAKAIAMTFKDDSFSSSIKSSKAIYSYASRLDILRQLGFDYVLALQFEDIKTLAPKQFLDMLFGTLDIASVSCGYDFRFGTKGGGDVELLGGMCDTHGATLHINSAVLYDGVRVSTTLIKERLESADFDNVNKMLGQPYFVKDMVISGRGEGRKNDVPTANININRDVFCLPYAVYGTYVELGDRVYKAVTNVGAKPTYNISETNIETVVLDYDGDLYDKYIKINFYKKLRDIVKFDSIESLICQINKDKNWEL